MGFQEMLPELEVCQKLAAAHPAKTVCWKGKFSQYQGLGRLSVEKLEVSNGSRTWGGDLVVSECCLGSGK